jgi:CCR4-NOT transcription complex subunit 1
MGILSVFRCVYNVEGLKMNIKFEVEVLCKNLGIKMEDIKRNELLACRVAPVKERNPDFNIKSSAAKPASAALGLRAWSGPQTRNRWFTCNTRSVSR